MKKLHERLGAVGKIAVAGMRCRTGNVVAKPVADVSALTLKGFIKDNVKSGATVYTDSFRSYSNLSGYNHEIVNHSVGELETILKKHPNYNSLVWANFYYNNKSRKSVRLHNIFQAHH